ncbi:hypothetical protein J6590_078015 [Homalodisca vitripennis]|nr:hypothetical protein J6590_078015 [Homalodisca vitripennis]
MYRYFLQLTRTPPDQTRCVSGYGHLGPDPDVSLLPPADADTSDQTRCVSGYKSWTDLYAIGYIDRMYRYFLQLTRTPPDQTRVYQDVSLLPPADADTSGPDPVCIRLHKVRRTDLYAIGYIDRMYRYFLQLTRTPPDQTRCDVSLLPPADADTSGPDPVCIRLHKSWTDLYAIGYIDRMYRYFLQLTRTPPDQTRCDVSLLPPADADTSGPDPVCIRLHKVRRTDLYAIGYIDRMYRYFLQLTRTPPDQTRCVSGYTRAGQTCTL